MFVMGFLSLMYITGCARSIDLSSKQCPCVEGFVCDPIKDTCVRALDADLDTDDAEDDVSLNDAPPVDVVPPSKKRVFISSASYNGNLGGVTGADAKCTALANNAELGGTWKAWLSSSGNLAKNRVQDVGPWYLVDESTLVANTRDELVACANLSQSINMTENGNVLDNTGTTLYFWSGHYCDGTLKPQTCLNWSNSASPNQGGFGVANDWSGGGNDLCNGTRRLVCFEQ